MAKNSLEVNLKKYSVPIDGLRAIAVIVVIINHFNESLLTSGYLGVDVFFVISGFVITSSMLNREKTSAKKFFGGFYKRRIKRLVPALLFCFIIAAISISFFSIKPQKYIDTGLLSIPGLSNINLFLNAVDYWGETSKLNPFTHTWSLAVEEQFYYIYPLIVWLLFSRKMQTASTKSLSLVVLSMSILSLGAFLYMSINEPMAAYFLMPFRFWEIGIGCLLFFHLKKSGNNFFDGFIKKFPLSILLILLIVVFFLPKMDNGLTTVLIVAITFLVMLKVKLTETIGSSELKILDNRFMVYIGKISYSLYLWHWIVLTIARWTIGISPTTTPIISLSFISLSIISYHLIEMPMRHMSWRKKLRPKISFAILLVPFFLIIYSFKFKTFNRFYLGTNFNQEKVNYESKLVPELNKTTCHTIRILGNSHSLHITPMIKVITNKYNITLITEKDPDYILIPNGDKKDITKLETVLEPMETGDLLILSSRMRYLYQIPYLNGTGEKWVEHSKLKEENGYGLDMWFEELNEVISTTKKNGINVVLFLPNIEFDVPIPNNKEICSEQWFRTVSNDCNPVVSHEFLDKRFPEIWYNKVTEIANENDNFFIFDPMPIYCPKGDNCPRIIDGVIAFRDTNHLTAEGAMLMLSEFYAFLLDNNLL